MKGNMGRWAALGMALGVALGVAHAILAATKAERGQTAGGAVQEALRQEIAGSNTDRKGLLAMALEHSPDYVPALWHSGYVREYNHWMKFSDLPDAVQEDGRLEAYRRVRDKYPATVEGQLELADWCAKHKLTDQQRAHLTKVLELNADQPEARRLLGFRMVDGNWQSEDEIAKTKQRTQDAEAAMRQWKPKIEKILSGLTQRGQQQRQAAADRLLAIRDAAAIGAIEAVLAVHSEETAMLVVQTLDKIAAPEAALALARQAVFSPWPPVRTAAAEKLRSRDPHTFVPALLGAMQGPIQSRAELYAAPNGRLVYRHAFFRDGQDQSQLAVFETQYRGNVAGDGGQAAVQGMRGLDAATKAMARQSVAVQQNTFTQLLNKRIADALAVATSQILPATADAWWKWWNEYNEVALSGNKPVKSYFHTETVRIAEPVPGSPGPGGPSGPGPAPRRYDCLAAGTRVWTDAGFQPIEQIKVGDRVLAQNPETGELAYKPVLRTTVRPAGSLVRIEADGETIQASGGHVLWVAGRGWTKARDIRPTEVLHGVTETRRVRSVVPTGFDETYNLVVADFHTYFIGRALLLTHDNTVREPTHAAVPGLAAK